jgi:hypothetical protein
MLKTLLNAAAALAILAAASSGARAQTAAQQAVLDACKTDIAKFCASVMPGGGRIKDCMKQHQQELSQPCKDAAFHDK